MIYFVVSTPGAQRRLQDEIDSVLPTAENPVQYSTVKGLRYFQACISESLRMYPPSFQLRERLSPSLGGDLGGYFIPGNTHIGINSKAAQLTDVYGKDVESFRPDRWLTADVERLKSMRRNLDLVWNHGSTRCLGMNIALMELNKCVFEVRWTR